MPEILDLFKQSTVLNFMTARQPKNYLGKTLFPEQKIPGLDFESLRAGNASPVIASLHAFDSEAEIGSREAKVDFGELALVKRKIQLREADLIKLRSPRNAAEQEYLTQQVFNDVDNMAASVEARVELMRMELLADGKITFKENGLNLAVDYNIKNKYELTGTDLWNDAGSDPLENLLDWINSMDVVPTRGLTSNRVIVSLIKHPTIQGHFKTMGLLPSRASLNAILEGMGLPVLMAYEEKYRVDLGGGKYETKRFFPENKITLLNDTLPGKTLFGITPEEARIAPQVSKDVKIGNVFATVYEETKDPIGTWTKASAVAMPTFPEADNVVQATVLPATV